MSEYLTADELALVLRLSPDTVRDLARRGKIPSIRISRKIIRYDRSAVDEALRATVDDVSPTGSEVPHE